LRRALVRLPNRPDLILPISWAVIIHGRRRDVDRVQQRALPASCGPSAWAFSGFGWGLGYCGGLVSLFIVLAVSMPAMFGLAANNDTPLFGLDAKSHELERLVGPAAALWLAVFVLPMFLFTPDSAGAPRQPLLVAAREGGRSLWSTLKRIPRFGNALRYLIAFMLYNDGLAAIIAFGGVYAAATFGWSTVTLGIFGIILTVFAIPGAFLGGRLDDWIGSKRTVQVAIAGVIVATLGIVGVTATHVLYVIPVDPISPTRGLFGSVQERTLMGFALLLGFCMGPMQAASRTLIGRSPRPR
jgi:UMF1 family MFS transporter